MCKLKKSSTCKETTIVCPTHPPPPECVFLVREYLLAHTYLCNRGVVRTYIYHMDNQALRHTHTHTHTHHHRRACTFTHTHAFPGTHTHTYSTYTHASPYTCAYIHTLNSHTDTHTHRHTQTYTSRNTKASFVRKEKNLLEKKSSILGSSAPRHAGFQLVDVGSFTYQQLIHLLHQNVIKVRIWPAFWFPQVHNRDEFNKSSREYR
jgi:hypothetical protein